MKYLKDLIDSNHAGQKLRLKIGYWAEDKCFVRLWIAACWFRLQRTAFCVLVKLLTINKKK